MTVCDNVQTIYGSTLHSLTRFSSISALSGIDWETILIILLQLQNRGKSCEIIRNSM